MNIKRFTAVVPIDILETLEKNLRAARGAILVTEDELSGRSVASSGH